MDAVEVVGLLATIVAMLTFTADVERLEVGPLRIEISRPPKEIGLNDPLLIEVTLQYPPNVALAPPAVKAGAMLDSALVTQVRVDGPDPIDGPFGRYLVQNWVTTLEPTKVGALALGKLKAQYQEKGKAAVEAEITLPSFDVKPGRLNVGPTAELKLPPAPETRTPVAETANAGWWMKAIGGGVLVACLLALALSSVKKSSPTDEARAAIASVQGTPRQAISRICDAVRAYLQKAHGVSAAHLTTPELFGDESLLAGLPAEKRTALGEVLPLADMLRFPQPEPTASDLERCRAAALRAIGPSDRD